MMTTSNHMTMYSFFLVKREPGEDQQTDFKPLSEEEGNIVFERRVGDLLGSREPEFILVQVS